VIVGLGPEAAGADREVDPEAVVGAHRQLVQLDRSPVSGRGEGGQSEEVTPGCELRRLGRSGVEELLGHAELGLELA
jgi:hypothetical protein